MTWHLHHLTGCAPAPLAHYLKALGILRVVGEQADDTARGWWQDEHFCLLTTLDRPALEMFFLDEYAPTPFVSPWNRGSGFYASRDPAIHPLEHSTAARFKPFRDGIGAARAPLAALREADASVRALKGRTKAHPGMSGVERTASAALRQDPGFKQELAAAERRFKQLKADLFKPCLRTWRGGHRRWMDAALVVLDDGRVAWPSLLGTGGSDGRLDFTNNLMFRLAELFDLESPDGRASGGSGGLLRDAMWTAASPTLTPGAAIGQFLPAGAGGANSTNAPDGNSLINPWDFVLMLEGSLLFSARATRRLDPQSASRASAPFAVRSQAVGYASEGQEKAQRGEQWLPIWGRPTGGSDLAAMLGDARIQLGRHVACRPLDVARAVTRLGVARGVRSFTRYGFLERNGQSTFAVPLGRVEVRSRPRARLVDEVAPWLDRLRRIARDDHAAARFVSAERRLADAVFAVLTHDDEPARWQAVLSAATGVEAVQASGTAFAAGPIPPLSPDWVMAADDGSTEWRLARSLGSAAADYDRSGKPHDSVRHHWLPLEEHRPRFKQKEKRLVGDVRVVMTGRDPVADLAALVERRLVEATGHGQRQLPLIAARGCETRPDDLARFVAGEVNVDRVSTLARPLMAVRWREWQGPRPSCGPDGDRPDAAWTAVRLACLPWPLFDGHAIPVDSAIVRRLVSGDGSAAVALALRRLGAAGLRPPLRAACCDPRLARLWAAALVFPVSLAGARALARQFLASE